MPLDPGAPLRLSPRHLTVALLLLALVAMGGVVRNQWVQDDTGIIRDNAMVHSIDGVWRAFTAPYWPSTAHRELYRPLAIAGFAAQWAIGDGAPWVFRIVNLAGYLASILALWALLRRLAGLPAAWVGAALFAVHPVHVEAVAVSVNQGETFVAALLLWATLLYLDWRQGRRSARSAMVGILALYIPALFIKEHALILPGLLVAVELSLLWRSGDAWGDRWRSLRGFYGTLVVAGGIFWLIRGQVLGGAIGTAPQEIIAGLTPGTRALTMLGVVPEWIRLLLWPAHLQSDWAPLEYVPYAGWTLRETLGVIGLGAVLLALIISWGRRPRVTFAILWLGIAIFPVSNLLVPTGVVIAERTLFLPSVAVALIAADLAEAWAARPSLQIGLPRLVAIGGLVAALGAGMLGSATRMVTWRDRVLFIASALEDAPRSYRVWLSWGMMLHEHGDTLAGDSAIARSMRLHPNEFAPFRSLAWKLQREGGHCRPALSLYRLMLNATPGRGDYRIGYVACATWLGRYEDAAREARAGIERRIDRGYLRDALLVIDSAQRVGAPQGTVLLPPLPGDWVTIGANAKVRLEEQ